MIERIIGRRCLPLGGAAIAREPVASKELSSVVSLLFATLAGRFISVAVKGLMGGEVLARRELGGTGRSWRN